MMNSMPQTSASANLDPMNSEQTGGAASGSSKPDSAINQSKDAQTMISVLKDMGIEEYEPRVVNQLMEFSYRYIISLLEDARAFSTHAGKKTIDSEDIKMAIKTKVDFSFTTTPPRDLLIEISKAKNKNTLPPIKYHSGIRLPPDRFCLHSQNYALKAPALQAQQNMANMARQQQQIQQQFGAGASSGRNEPQSSSFMFSETASASALLEAAPSKRRREDEDDYDI